MSYSSPVLSPRDLRAYKRRAVESPATSIHAVTVPVFSQDEEEQGRPSSSSSPVKVPAASSSLKPVLVDLEDLSSGVVGIIDADGVLVTHPSCELLDAGVLDALCTRILALPSTPDTTTALLDLRRAVLKRGSDIQQQVVDTPFLPARIAELVHGCPTKILTNVACRVLCATAARNQATTAFWLRHTPSLHTQLVRILKVSAAHLTTRTCGADAACTADGCFASIVPDALPCNVLRTAAAAMWTLAALCKLAVAVADALLDDHEVMSAIFAHLGADDEESQSSASWILFSMVSGRPAHVQRLLTFDVEVPLLRQLSTGKQLSKGLACWALRALIDGNAGAKARCFASDAITVLGDAIRASADVLIIQSSMLWALASLATNFKQAQDRIRDQGYFTDVLELLSSPAKQIQGQAVAFTYHMCARNPDNQSFAGDAGAIEKLVAMLPLVHGVNTFSAVFVEKVVACLLALVLRHPPNQERFGAMSACPILLSRLIQCTSLRVRGLAASVIRSAVVDQSRLQVLFAAYGVFPPLVELLACKDDFAQEQAMACVLNLLSHTPSNKSLLLAFKGEEHVFNLLADCTKPTNLAYLTAIMSLYVLCQDDAALSARVKADERVMHALLRLCHPSFVDPRVRGHADRLLLLIAPEVHADRPRRCPGAVMGALNVCRPNRAPHSTQLDCAICMTDDDEDFCFLPCLHGFHHGCVKAWFDVGKDTCPMCKSSVLKPLNESTGGGLGAAGHDTPAL